MKTHTRRKSIYNLQSTLHKEPQSKYNASALNEIPSSHLWKSGWGLEKCTPPPNTETPSEYQVTSCVGRGGKQLFVAQNKQVNDTDSATATARYPDDRTDIQNNRVKKGLCQKCDCCKSACWLGGENGAAKMEQSSTSPFSSDMQVWQSKAIPVASSWRQVVLGRSQIWIYVTASMWNRVLPKKRQPSLDKQRFQKAWRSLLQWASSRNSSIISAPVEVQGNTCLPAKILVRI